MPSRDILTVIDKRTLEAGVRHPRGIINPQISRYGMTERRMGKLVRLGFAIPNAHGDWYITETGRKAIAG